MMKRNILTVVIPIMLVASAANSAEIYDKGSNKLDLYGKITGIRYFSNNEISNSDHTYARLGFSGKTQINDQLIGYGQWEYHFVTNNSGNNSTLQNIDNTRLAYVGLRAGDYSSFDYGRNYGIVYDALSYTNVLPGFGGDTAYNDNFFVGRVSGVATYRNTNFFGLVDGLNFGIQYLGKNKRTNDYITNGDKSDNFSDVRCSNGDGWGASLSYEFDDGLSIAGAYGTANRTNAQQDSVLLRNRDKAEQWVTGLKYDANNIYLAGNYGKTHNATPISGGFANKTKDILLVAQYKFDFGLRPSIAYTQSKVKDIEGIVDDEDLIKYIEIGAVYCFNDSVSSYVDYKINQIGDKNKLGANSDNAVALGITYQF